MFGCLKAKLNMLSCSRPPPGHTGWLVLSSELEELKVQSSSPLHCSSSQPSQLCAVEVILEQTVATPLAFCKPWATRIALEAASGTILSMPVSKTKFGEEQKPDLKLSHLVSLDSQLCGPQKQNHFELTESFFFLQFWSAFWKPPAKSLFFKLYAFKETFCSCYYWPEHVHRAGQAYSYLTHILEVVH